MSSISAISGGIAPQLPSLAKPKSGKADGDGDHGVEPAAKSASAAPAPSSGGAVRLTA